MKKQVFLFILSLFISPTLFAQRDYNLLIGTYTNTGKSEGIYTYGFDDKTGNTQLKSIAKNVVNPSFLIQYPNKKFIYCVNENGNKSAISAFKFNAKTRALSFLNKQDTKGIDPCYIITDANNIITANYSSGNISVFKHNTDGGISKAEQIIQHQGKGAIAGRQDSPHTHLVQFTPDKKHVIANDLGADKIYIYQYNPESDNPLIIKDSIQLKPGSGPRHLTFSKNGKFVYVLNEINGGINVFNYAYGKLSPLQEVESPLKDIIQKIDAADIHLSPDGKFLYASNRGDANNILTFAVEADGKLTFKNQTSTLGIGPRNFAIDPSGNYLLVAHQKSDNVVIFKRNKITGNLTDTGKRIEVGAPVCLVFAQ